MSRPSVPSSWRGPWAYVLAVALIILGLVIALSPLFPAAIFTPLGDLLTALGHTLNAVGLQGPPFVIGISCSALGIALLWLAFTRRRQSALRLPVVIPPAAPPARPTRIAQRQAQVGPVASSPAAVSGPDFATLADTTIYYDAENVAISQERVPAFLAFIDKALQGHPATMLLYTGERSETVAEIERYGFTVNIVPHHRVTASGRTRGDKVYNAVDTQIIFDALARGYRSAAEGRQEHFILIAKDSDYIIMLRILRQLNHAVSLWSTSLRDMQRLSAECQRLGIPVGLIEANDVMILPASLEAAIVATINAANAHREARDPMTIFNQTTVQQRIAAVGYQGRECTSNWLMLLHAAGVLIADDRLKWVVANPNPASGAETIRQALKIFVAFALQQAGQPTAIGDLRKLLADALTLQQLSASAVLESVSQRQNGSHVLHFARCAHLLRYVILTEHVENGRTLLTFAPVSAES